MRKQENILKVKAFSKNFRIYFADERTAEHYGAIKSNLKEKGTPIPENDIWIAALSFQHKIDLVSRDAHFELTKGLRLVNLDLQSALYYKERFCYQ